MSSFGDVGREEISNKTQIEKLVDEIKESAIGFENYKKFFEKINSSDQVILSQIENLVREFREFKKKHDEAMNMKSNQQMREDGYIRVEIYEDSLMMNKILKEAFAWKTLQEELYSIIFHKISAVLDDARALDIKRDALKEMRESDKERQAMFIEIMKKYADMFRGEVTSKLNHFDEKFINLVMMIDEDNRRDRKDIFNGFKQIMDVMNLKDKIVSENFGDTESKVDRFKKQYGEEDKRKKVVEPEKERKVTSQKLKSKKSKIDDIDDEFDNFNDDDEDFDNEDKFDDGRM